MSTIVTDTITGKSTATTITIGSTPVVSASANSMTIRGEGTAQTSIQQGLCKVWARTNMSTAANTDSLNISSITDQGTGFFTITINNDMGNGDYTVTCAADNVTSNDNTTNQVESHTAGSYVILHKENGNQVDTTSFGHSVHGDLA